MSEALREEAREILETLSMTSFENCYSLSRDFEVVPSDPGFYAFIAEMGSCISIVRTIF